MTRWIRFRRRWSTTRWSMNWSFSGWGRRRVVQIKTLIGHCLNVSNVSTKILAMYSGNPFLVSESSLWKSISRFPLSGQNKCKPVEGSRTASAGQELIPAHFAWQKRWQSQQVMKCLDLRLVFVRHDVKRNSILKSNGQNRGHVRKNKLQAQTSHYSHYYGHCKWRASKDKNCEHAKKK